MAASTEFDLTIVSEGIKKSFNEIKSTLDLTTNEGKIKLALLQVGTAILPVSKILEKYLDKASTNKEVDTKTIYVFLGQTFAHTVLQVATHDILSGGINYYKLEKYRKCLNRPIEDIKKDLTDAGVESKSLMNLAIILRKDTVNLMNQAMPTIINVAEKIKDLNISKSQLKDWNAEINDQINTNISPIYEAESNKTRKVRCSFQ